MSVESCLLCLRVPLETLLGFSRKLYDDDSYLQRYNEKIALKVATKASKLLRSAYLKSPADMCGKSPRGLMAGALYIAGVIEDERKTQDDISLVVNVATETLRIRYKHLMGLLDLEIESFQSHPTEYTKQGKDWKETLEKKETTKKIITTIESCWAEDCDYNQNKSCNAPKISLIKIHVSFHGKPIVVCRCLEYTKRRK